MNIPSVKIPVGSQADLYVKSVQKALAATDETTRSQIVEKEVTPAFEAIGGPQNYLRLSTKNKKSGSVHGLPPRRVWQGTWRGNNSIKKSKSSFQLPPLRPSERELLSNDLFALQACKTVTALQPDLPVDDVDPLIHSAGEVALDLDDCIAIRLKRLLTTMDIDKSIKLVKLIQAHLGQGESSQALSPLSITRGTDGFTLMRIKETLTEHARALLKRSTLPAQKIRELVTAVAALTYNPELAKEAERFIGK